MWLDSKAVNCPQKWGNFIPTLIQAQICLKFTPQTTQTPRQPIFFANPPVTPARFRVGPLLESFFNTELRFLHNPG